MGQRDRPFLRSPHSPRERILLHQYVRVLCVLCDLCVLCGEFSLVTTESTEDTEQSELELVDPVGARPKHEVKMIGHQTIRQYAQRNGKETVLIPNAMNLNLNLCGVKLFE